MIYGHQKILSYVSKNDINFLLSENVDNLHTIIKLYLLDQGMKDKKIESKSTNNELCQESFNLLK